MTLLLSCVETAFNEPQVRCNVAVLLLMVICDLR